MTTLSPINWRARFERALRHVQVLVPLAWPAVMSRLGVVLLGTVDTIIVGQYSTKELAYLNVGSGSFIMFVLVAGIGLLVGTSVFSAEAMGRNRPNEAGAAWRRGMPLAITFGLLSILVTLPSETLFMWTGQTSDMAREAGRVMTILGFGLIGHLIYVNGTFFLEGVEKPKVAMWAMAIANIINLGLDYVLVFGAFGIPAMGAEGSAWATAILRLLMGIGIVAFIWYAPSMQMYRVRDKPQGNWHSWRGQRHLGYSSAVSVGAEVAAFSALSVFSGLLGTLTAAAYGVIFNIIAIPFMLAAGIGSATTVRVGILRGRKDFWDMRLAGLTGVSVVLVLLAIVGLIVNDQQMVIAGFYTDDVVLLAAVAPAMLITGIALWVDGGQAVLAAALRGLGEVWMPMFIQSFCYLILMIPLAYRLGVAGGRGLTGLIESMIVAGILSMALQGWWYHKASGRMMKKIH